MSIYINPNDGTSKEDFLSRFGIQVNKDAFTWEAKPNGHLPIILVDNGTFTAAVVAINKKDFDYYLDTKGRPATYHYVFIKHLYSHSDLLRYSHLIEN